MINRRERARAPRGRTALKSLIIGLLLVTMAHAEVTEVHIVNGELWVENRTGTASYGSLIYSTNPPSGPVQTPLVWREVYGVRDGRIVFLRKVEAKVTPRETLTTEKPERVEWPKE